MQSTDEFVKKNKKRINRPLFEQLCEECNFVCVERTNIDIEDEKLKKLFEYAYVFIKDDGKKYLVANTEYSLNDAYRLIMEKSLRQHVVIIGPGFEGKDSTLVVFNERNLFH